MIHTPIIFTSKLYIYYTHSATIKLDVKIYQKDIDKKKRTRYNLDVIRYLAFGGGGVST
jgi:hypothetical protein